jgi:hydroxyacylglutathione hydrolase
LKITQLLVGKMNIFCYLVGDESSKTCALIDPAFETDRILDAVMSEGYTVTTVINTHAHWDHTAGNAVIMAATDAKLLSHKLQWQVLARLVNGAFSRMAGGRRSPKPDRLLEDGDVIEIGQSALKVIHTPGHTRDSICLLGEGNLFTGDTLFVHFVGRTDLPGGSKRLLRESIKKKLYTLPDDTIVWPGHHFGHETASTIGKEKRSNIGVKAD